MKHGWFVAGTDTGVGKTLVSAALVYGYAQLGWTSVGMKPVAAGCQRQQSELISEDVELLRAASNLDLPRQAINPYAFEPALAPHIAAHEAGVEVSLAHIDQVFRQVATSVDVLVVEGVGGFRVPLNATQDTADMAVMLGLPVILVVGMRLGCLSHALLTVEAMASRGLNLAGWVANCIDPDMEALEANVAALDSRIPAPRLGLVRFQSAPAYAEITNLLDFKPILNCPLDSNCKSG